MFWVSMLATLLAVVALFAWGLNLGIDFKGGSITEISFSPARPDVANFNEVLSKAFPDIEITSNPFGDNGILIKTVELTEPEHQRLLEVISNNFLNFNPTEDRFDSIGPAIGEELKTKSVRATILVLIAIVVYIAFVFRSLSGVLSPWAMGISAVFAMAHDILIPLGIFAWLSNFYGVEISAVFVAAILTVLGYSVSDSVVVFDRVRENVIRYGRKEDFGVLVHKSVMQTLTRSLNTTFTTLLSLIAIYIFGGDTLKYFSLALIVGIFLGSYSSIFVASPILYYWSKRFKR